jgi:hypothetical protein
MATLRACRARSGVKRFDTLCMPPPQRTCWLPAFTDLRTVWGDLQGYVSNCARTCFKQRGEQCGIPNA